MWLIAGLGNPEKKYNGTRHNAGFAVIDALLEMLGGKGLESTKFHGAFTKLRIGTEEVVILKPLTYMNLSGDSIAPMANFYKIPPEQVLVVSDEISLSPGSIRIRKKGSAGGHNGLKSIIARLGTEDFPRIRLGVGEKRKEKTWRPMFSAISKKKMKSLWRKPIQRQRRPASAPLRRGLKRQ